MKVQLVVAQGVHAGRQIPIMGPQFVIGRDPDCQLRPASAAISKRHCAVVIRGNQVFVRDFGSTNGTFVNDEIVKGEVEVKQDDRVKVGPLDFTMSIVATEPAAVPKPKSARTAASEEDESMAALLLEDDGGPAPAAQSVPEGSTTIMDLKSLQQQQQQGDKKPDKKDSNTADTSSAAADILKKYQKRPRS